MSKAIKFPLYAKLSILIIGLYVFISVLYIGRGIIVPLIFAFIIAIVLHPVVVFLVKKRMNRVLAIVITLLLAILIIAGISTFVFSNASRFTESLPKLADKFTELLNQAVIWTSGYFNISTREITEWIGETKAELIDTSGLAIGSTILSVGSKLALAFLLPVYIFLILYYQPILLEFFHKLFGAHNRIEVGIIINQVKTLIQGYLIGLSIEVLIVATLFTSGLLILGIEYALLLGVIGALLNLIPYLGAFLGAILPMIMAIVTKPSPWFAFLVLGLFIFVQLIDNNYIVPRVVASKVKINALVSITAVLVFGALWGIPGMFLAIPLTGIIKLVFDNVKPLKPWGFLLGDTMPVNYLNNKQSESVSLNGN